MGWNNRIIIYSDFNNRKLVEQSIKSVYQSSPQLFNGCERSAAWLYNSDVSGVYFAPETPGDAYSNRLADVILEAKETFNFLYGITNSNKNITLSGKDADQAIEYMKLLIGSIMLRKGILLSKDGKCINVTFKSLECDSINKLDGYVYLRFINEKYGFDTILEIPTTNILAIEYTK